MPGGAASWASKKNGALDKCRSVGHFTYTLQYTIAGAAPADDTRRGGQRKTGADKERGKFKERTNHIKLHGTPLVKRVSRLSSSYTHVTHLHRHRHRHKQHTYVRTTTIYYHYYSYVVSSAHTSTSNNILNPRFFYC